MTKPSLNIPPVVRFAVYVILGVGSLVMTYLGARGTVGADEMALWTGLSAFIGGLAALNTDPGTGKHAVRPVEDEP